MALLIIKTSNGDYVEIDDRRGALFIAAHGHTDEPVSYARLNRKEARWVHDKLSRFLEPKPKKKARR